MCSLFEDFFFERLGVGYYFLFLERKGRKNKKIIVILSEVRIGLFFVGFKKIFVDFL